MIEPDAIIPGRRNTYKGINNRSKILIYLGKRIATTSEIAEYMNMSRNGILYHLKLLEDVGILTRRRKYWIVHVRQRKIEEYIKKKVKKDEDF